MAIYHLDIQPISRAKGRSATAKAAYNAAERFQDERLGITWDYTRKSDLIYKEILAPQNASEWMKDRSKLWNHCELIEKRKDARPAMSLDVSLPRELTEQQNIELAKEFAKRSLVDRGLVADICLHRGHGEDQPHIHILYTTREIVDREFGKKIESIYERKFVYLLREEWANVANKHLALYGHDVKIDHRSYAEQGIDLEPQKKIGPKSARLRYDQNVQEHAEIARRNGEKIFNDPSIVLTALTSQQSTFSMHDLAKFINRHTADTDQFTRVFEKVKAYPELAALGKDDKGQERYTSFEMLEAEHRMVTQALAKTEVCEHQVDLNNRNLILSKFTLSSEQKTAFEYITDDRDIAAVVGFAGTGKSYMLQAAKEVWESESYNVIGMTLSGVAADQLEGASGIKSYTVANRITNWKYDRARLTQKDIVVIDEAGMLGSRDLSHIMNEVTRAGAKVVLVGDQEQLQAIQAGAGFRAILERIGYVKMQDIRRQSVNWQKEAIKNFATGKAGEALDMYNRRGFIREFDTQKQAMSQLIEDWSESRIQESNKSRIILAYRRVEVKELNKMAREWRIKNDELDKGQLVKTASGKKEFSVNERIYFLKNDRDLGVKNGNLGIIESIQGHKMKVRIDSTPYRNAKVVEVDTREYNNLDYGYAATVHKAQAITVDRTYLLGSKYLDRHAWYVGFSRARHSSEVYWSKEEFKSFKQLKFYANKIREKDLTLDYPTVVEGFGKVRGINIKRSQIINVEDFKDRLNQAAMPYQLAQEIKELKSLLKYEVEFKAESGDMGVYRGDIKLDNKDYSVIERPSSGYTVFLPFASKTMQVKEDQQVRVMEQVSEDGKLGYGIVTEKEWGMTLYDTQDEKNKLNEAKAFVEIASRKLAKAENYNLRDKLSTKDIYKSLYHKLPSILPEFGFIRKGDCYVSTTSHKVDGSDGKKGKVYVYANNPGVIIDYTRGNKSIWDYFSEQVRPGSGKHELFEYLATLAGLRNEFSEKIEPLKKTEKIELPIVKVVEPEKAKVSSETWNKVQEFALQKVDIAQNQVVKYLGSERAYSKEMIKAMGIGYIPNKKELETYLKAKGLSEENIKEVVIALGYIGGKHKMTIPYYDAEGKIIGFVGRNIKHSDNSEFGKYMYTKGLARNSTLFNIHLANQNKPLVIVEGMLDALHAKAKGIDNVVALGGAGMGIRQAELLDSLKVKEVILCLDNDKAGKDASTRIAILLNEKLPEVALKQVSLPKGIKDADQLIKEQGRDVFETLISNALTVDRSQLEKTQELEKELIIKTEQKLGASLRM